MDLLSPKKFSTLSKRVPSVIPASCSFFVSQLSSYCDSRDCDCEFAESSPFENPAISSISPNSDLLCPPSESFSAAKALIPRKSRIPAPYLIKFLTGIPVRYELSLASSVISSSQVFLVEAGSVALFLIATASSITRAMPSSNIFFVPHPSANELKSLVIGMRFSGDMLLPKFTMVLASQNSMKLLFSSSSSSPVCFFNIASAIAAAIAQANALATYTPSVLPVSLNASLPLPCTLKSFALIRFARSILNVVVGSDINEVMDLISRLSLRITSERWNTESTTCVLSKTSIALSLHSSQNSSDSYSTSGCKSFCSALIAFHIFDHV